MSGRKPGKAETGLLADIVAALKRYPVLPRRLHSGKVQVKRGWMYLGEEGWPDLVVFVPGGRCVFIETKGAKATKVSDEQEAIHAQLRGMGHVVAVCRDVQSAIDAVAAEINGYRIVAKDAAMQDTADLLARVAAHGRR